MRLSREYALHILYSRWVALKSPSSATSIHEIASPSFVNPVRSRFDYCTVQVFIRSFLCLGHYTSVLLRSQRPLPTYIWSSAKAEEHSVNVDDYLKRPSGIIKHGETPLQCKFRPPRPG
jgi:hypothetical protein